MSIKIFEASQRENGNCADSFAVAATVRSKRGTGLPFCSCLTSLFTL